MESDALFSAAPSSFAGGNQILSALNEVAILLPVFLLIFTWRGFMQALIAKMMGDRTPEDDGFLTLNPLAHVDLVGMLMILGGFFFAAAFLSSAIPRTILLMMLIMTGVRWTIPVHIDDRNFKNYRLGGIITSLTGPLSNFLLAFASVGMLRLVIALNLAPFATITIVEIIKMLIHLTLFFGVIALVPLPPFDGGKILHYALPYRLQWIVQKLEEYSLIILLVILFAPGISTLFFGGIFKVAWFIKRIMFSVFFNLGM